ncbi:MAG: deoxyuridine 5'-triphosphate nucleotidohydrolase [Desulfurococcales archaeon]|nr:deoxyuridine 5'-triphosphate nucleotidohydrolase [Desulfurococcales archaeon]
MALPGSLISELIEGLIDRGLQEQPAGVDLTVRKIFTFINAGVFRFEDKELSRTEEVPPEGGKWKLPQGAYKIRFNEVVKIPEDALGLCLPRSSLLRSGVDIRCAVWDPGYYGRGEALLAVLNPNGVEIGVDARVAQLILVRLAGRPKKLYRGGYWGENID